jgi:integrase
MRGGGYWTDTAYRNWRRKVFRPAAGDAGVTSLRPYDLRHSFASLLFAEAANPAEIAEQLGHSIQTLLNTYTRVMEELRGKKPRSAETLIRQARGKHGPQKAPAASSAANQVESADAEALD